MVFLGGFYRTRVPCFSEWGGESKILDRGSTECWGERKMEGARFWGRLFWIRLVMKVGLEEGDGTNSNPKRNQVSQGGTGCELSLVQQRRLKKIGK